MSADNRELGPSGRARQRAAGPGPDARGEGEARMAAMKPRTGDGPLEVTKEGRGIVMRVPLEGGGRLVVELNATEAPEPGQALTAVVSCHVGSGLAAVVPDARGADAAHRRRTASAGADA